MASPVINYGAYTTLPADPTPEQLARWLADGRSVLRDAADPLRLYDAVASGRATPDQRRRLLGRLIDGAKAQLGSLAHWLADGLTHGVATLGSWYRRFSDISATHNYAGVMAATGTIDPTPADRAAADGEVRKQLGFLGRFREQLRTGAQPLYLPKSDKDTGERVVHGRMVARSEMYGDAVWGTAEGVLRQKMLREGFTHERRQLGGKHHCSTCKDQAHLGWQPIGTLRRIGDSPCATNCRCTFTFTHDNLLSEDLSPLGHKPDTTPRKTSVSMVGAATPKPAPAPAKPPAKPLRLPTAARPAKVPGEPPLTFTASDRSRRDKDRMVYIDVAKLDAAWSKDTSYYLSPGGTGPSGIAGRYQAFERFLETAKADGKPIEMSQVYVDASGNVSFVDGRHRFAVLRDAGVTVIPVAVDPEAAGRMAEMFGATRKPPRKK